MHINCLTVTNVYNFLKIRRWILLAEIIILFPIFIIQQVVLSVTGIAIVSSTYAGKYFEFQNLWNLCARNIHLHKCETWYY